MTLFVNTHRYPLPRRETMNSRFTKSITRVALMLMCVSACTQSDQKPPQVTQPQEAPPPPPFKLKGELSDLTLPKNLVLVGGFNQIDETSRQLERGLPNFLPTSFDLRAQWLNNYVQTELRIESKFVHSERPLRVMRFKLDEGDGALLQSHTVHLIGVTDAQALIKSLGRVEHVEHQGKDVYVYRRYKGDKSPSYFTFLEDEIVVTAHKLELLSRDYISFYNQLSHVRIPGLISALFFPQQLTLSQGEVKDQQQALEALELKGSKASIERQRGLLRAGVELGHQVARDSEQVSLVIKFDQRRLVFDLDWRLRRDSRASQMLSRIQGGAHTLLQELGAAAFVISAQLPKDALVALVRAWNQVALNTIQVSKKTQPKTPQRQKVNRKKSQKKKRKKHTSDQSLYPVLGQSPALITEYLRTAVQAAQELTGELTLAIVPHIASSQPEGLTAPPSPQAREGAAPTSEIFLAQTNQKSLRWVGLFGHRGQEETLKKIRATLDIYSDPEVKRAMRRRGLVVKIKDDDALEGISGRSIHIKSRMPRTPRSLRPLRPQLKELYNAHLWIGERRGVIGFDDSWRETLKRHASSTPAMESDRAESTGARSVSVEASATAPASQQSANQPSDAAASALRDESKPNYVRDALNAGVQSPLLFMYLNPVTLISALKRGRSGSILLPLQMMFSSLPNTEGIGLTLGREGQSVNVRLTVAQALLRAIKQGMSGTLGTAPSPTSP